MSKEREGRPGKAKGRESRCPAPEAGDLLTDASRLQRAMERPADGNSLGERIRRARELHGLTLEDLSSRTGIARQALEKVESNELIPPLGSLIKVGKAVAMKMGYFISPGVEKALTVVRSDRRPAISRHGQKRSEQCGYSYESLAPEKADRLMEPFLVTLAPNRRNETSSHDGQEFIFVLEGEVRVQVGPQEEILRPGDAAYYDSGPPHRVGCRGARPAKILAVLITAGK
ncbi:MAG: helix-turn-helix transcriptional regulator [Deltaproteobacteria bacterium]|nr:helix-turn-helix transcriptional regulator [Deltaproteobacteria bacterium]